MDPPSPCPQNGRLRRSTPEQRALPSSPSLHSSRSRKPPSVTPRRFSRFFAPRSAQQGSQTMRINRTILGDISSAGGNRRFAQSSPIKQSQRLFDGDENGHLDALDTTPERSSPLKRICRVHPRDLVTEVAPLSHQDIPPSSPPTYPSTPVTCQPVIRRLRKSLFRKAYGSVIRREVDWAASATRSVRADICSTNMQSETAHFYSSEDDFHYTYNLDREAPTRTALPFRFTPCNTNSLAAIADEEGYIRLVETGLGQNPPLAKDYLNFRAHRNAILDIDFSEDDSLLATASGDQTSQVIDMRTQKALYTCWGHRSSLRQVKFQPGSGGRVLATAGRDGMIMIWDTRCTPVERPSPAAPVTHLGGQVTTHDPEKVRKYAQHVHQFMPPIPRNKDGKVPNEKSVTALSFISSSNSHYLLSGSATGPIMSLWDIRKMRLSSLSGQNALVGRASPNPRDNSHRGLLSLALSGDKSRIYALSRDSTAYVYSTAQLLNEGSHAQALYGFRDKNLVVNTWYHTLAVRRAQADKTELLAVAGQAGRAILFPTNEAYMRSGMAASSTNKAGVRIYEHGTTLYSGHDEEVSDVAWTNEGNLCTAADDFKCRVWREDAQRVKAMKQTSKANDGNMHLSYCGWAEVGEGFDEDEV